MLGHHMKMSLSKSSIENGIGLENEVISARLNGVCYLCISISRHTGTAANNRVNRKWIEPEVVDPSITAYYLIAF